MVFGTSNNDEDEDRGNKPPPTIHRILLEKVQRDHKPSTPSTCSELTISVKSSMGGGFKIHVNHLVNHVIKA